MAGKTAILSVRILGDAKGAVNAMGQAEGKASRLSGVMKGLGGAALGAATVAGGALIGLGVAGVKAAGDLQQSMGAVDVVFKDGADEVHAFANSAATDLGLTGNEYRELATLMGTQLKNGGTSLDELGGKTHELMGLGADLAATFGGSTSDAVGALSSALKGERDPIEKYGISLTQAAIDAKAAELGFQKVGGTLSTQAQQAATLALIMDQSADAQGQFGRETGTFAGQVSILTAQWGNFVAQVGMMLLPLLTTLLTFVTGSVMPGLQAFADTVGPGITEAISKAGPAITGLIGAFTGAAAGASPLQGVLAAVLPHLMSIGQAVIGFLPTLLSLGQTVFPLIVSAVSTVVPIMAQIAATVIPAVLGVLGQLLPILGTIAAAVIPAVVSAFQTLAPMVLAAVPPLVSIATTILGIFGPAIDWLLPLVTGIFGALVTQISGAIQIITGVLTTVAALLRGDWSGAWQGVQQIVTGVITVVRGTVQQGLTWITSFTGTKVSQIKKTFTDGFNAARTAAVSAVQTLVARVTAFIGNLLSSVISRMNAIRSGIASAVNSARAIAITAFAGLVSGAISRVSALVSNVRGLPGQIKSALGNLGNLLRSAGRDLIQGLINGIGSMGSALRTKASNLAGSAVSAIKSRLGIASPSRVMLQVGRWTGEGFVRGIDRMQSGAAAAMRDLVKVPRTPQMNLPRLGLAGAAGSVVIHEGDVHVEVHGVIDDAMVSKIEQAIVRAKQRRGAAAGSRLVVAR